MEKREEDLLVELEWLRHNQADLDARLQRVEESLIFRVLRGIGSFYKSNFQSSAGASVGEYQAWLRRRLAAAPRADPGWAYQPLIGIRGDGASLRGQSYSRWTQDLGEAEYVGELPTGVNLEPCALAAAVGAMQEARPGLVYFDHQIVDEAGEPLRPVFKPDWSPVLMESSDYVGPFVLRSRETRVGVVHVPVLAYSSRAGLQIREKFPVPAKGSPLVSIVICTRNSELLERCLTGLRGNTQYPAYEVVVVRHSGSEHDERVAELARETGAIRVDFEGPFHFSQMNQLGARAAKGEILLFLNDDVTPLETRWLERMVARLEDPETGAVGAKLVYYNGSIQHAGLTTWDMGGAGHPGRFLTQSDYWPWLNCSREVTAVTGACFGIRRIDWDRVGGFSDDFPINYNDVDLCLRLRELGFKTVYEAGALLQHDESQTRSAGVGFEERRRFFLRWHARLKRGDPFYSRHLAQGDEGLKLLG